MLITNKEELIRLKLIHGRRALQIVAYANSYTVDGNYELRTYTQALVDVGSYWSIMTIEMNGESKQNKWGGYGGGHVGEEKYIKKLWQKTVNEKIPTWHIERRDALHQKLANSKD